TKGRLGLDIFFGIGNPKLQRRRVVNNIEYVGALNRNLAGDVDHFRPADLTVQPLERTERAPALVLVDDVLQHMRRKFKKYHFVVGDGSTRIGLMLITNLGPAGVASRTYYLD